MSKNEKIYIRLTKKDQKYLQNTKYLTTNKIFILLKVNRYRNSDDVVLLKVLLYITT